MTNDEKVREERRRYPRIEESVELQLKSDEFVLSSASINLSCNGVYCRTQRPIPLMTSIKIVITLPFGVEETDVEFVECCGVVVRVEEEDDPRGFKTAIFISEMEEYERNKLASFIKGCKVKSL